MDFPGHSNPPKRHKLLANAALHHPHPPPTPKSTLPTTPLQPIFLMPSLSSTFPQPSHHTATDSNRDCALSLSLSSPDRDHVSLRDHFSDGPVKRELVNSGNEVWSRSSVPLGPFTGYASILSRSRFLKPAQDLLDEFCGTKLGLASRNPLQGLDDFDGASPRNLIHGDGEDSCRSSSLILLLDEVFRRYKQFYQHMQSVVASFETVPGLGNASPYVSFALRTLQYQFSCLKKTIFEQTQIAVEPLICGHISKENSALDPSYENQEQVQGSRQPVWRTQRGLPASAVAVFKKWLFEHFLHPYPSDTEKHLLAKQTGLSRSQVSNWFINARVRLWKPLVEEIHTLDTQQGQPASVSDPKSSQPMASDTLALLRSAHNAPAQLSMQCDDQLDPSSSWENNADYRHLLRTSKGNQRRGNVGISLALGLQQDNENGMPSQPN